MSRRSSGGGGGILFPLLIFLILFGGMGGYGGTAVDSEVNATAEVVDTEMNEDSITAHVNVPTPTLRTVLWACTSITGRESVTG